MSGWSNLSNELFRMSHNVNQTIWASGTGRKSYGGAMQGKPVIIKSAKPKKLKKLHKGIPEGLENAAESENPEAVTVEETEKKTGRMEAEKKQMKKASEKKETKQKRKSAGRKNSGREKSQEEFLISEEPSTEESGKNPRSGRLEQQAAQMRARSTELQTAERDIASAAESQAGIQVNNPEELQTAVLWAEILGDPVSVRRRKKRMNQYYGN